MPQPLLVWKCPCLWCIDPGAEAFHSNSAAQLTPCDKATHRRRPRSTTFALWWRCWDAVTQRRRVGRRWSEGADVLFPVNCRLELLDISIIYIYNYIYIIIYIYIHIYTYIYIHIYIYLYMYIYIHIYSHVCHLYVYLNMHMLQS